MKFIANLVGFFIFFIGINSNVYAFFCSSNKGHGYINVGDSMQQVQRICGTPDVVSSDKVGGTRLGTVQYWTYTTLPLQTLFGAVTPKHAITEPPAITFAILDNKVVSISTEGKEVQSSSNCTNRKTIRVGDSADTLKRRCGQPTVTRLENKVLTTPNQAVETWTYNVPSGEPVVLEFTDGALTRAE